MDTHSTAVTVNHHILQQQRKFPGATGQFTDLLSSLCYACKVISFEVNRAGLGRLMGSTGVANVQGEVVQRLDDFANRTLKEAMDASQKVCALASEEEEGMVPLDHPGAKYVIVFDPLDGSSNIDVNVSIGTIFSIFRRKSESGPGKPGTMADLLQRGDEHVAAGYAIYGSSTMLVLSTGQGADGFTLDPSIGEFLLSHPNIQMPERGRVYSANEGNARHWRPEMRRYVDGLKAGQTPRSLRYIGSLVADFHRNLLQGGLFLYPDDCKNSPADSPVPQFNEGKLRLLYEAFPLAFIAQQAGGRASDGRRDILDQAPRSLHQRTPLIIGSRGDVEDCLTALSS